MAAANFSAVPHIAALPATDASAALLVAQSLSKSYGRRVVFRDVGFVVTPGSLVGIVGENGAGKSTLLRILAGELRPNSGSVTVRGALGYCPQTVVLNDALSVDQHLDYFRAAYRIGDLRRAHDLVDQLGYTRYRTTPVGALSGGTQQKLNLTLALMHDPTVLLLDEPYQGFDWETYLRFWDLCAELRARGCAVLVISHLLFDRSRFDTIYRLAEGHLEREPLGVPRETARPATLVTWRKAGGRHGLTTARASHGNALLAARTCAQSLRGGAAGGLCAVVVLADRRNGGQ